MHLSVGVIGKVMMYRKVSELNSGVLGIRRCSVQRALIKYWLKLYDAVDVQFDQATLRAALWWAVSKRGLRTWVLPSEYNLRTPKPCSRVQVLQ